MSCSRGATGEGSNDAILLRCNLDVLLGIAGHLDLSSIARLSQTCRQLLSFVEDHGWKSLYLRGSNSNSSTLDTLNPKVVIPSKVSGPFIKHLLQVDRAWQTKTFRSYQNRLPPVKTSNGRVERHQPQPLLLLTPLALMLFTGSEMRLWSSKVLQRLEPLIFKHAQIFYLTNPAGLDRQTMDENSGVRPSSPAMWDICTCTQLDPSGEYIAIGRLNGLVEIIRLSRVDRQPRNSARLRADLAWIWRDPKAPGSIQSMHACPLSKVLAVAGRTGSITVFELSWKGGKLQVHLAEQFKINIRPWSILVRGLRWIAVGVNDVRPIILIHRKSTYVDNEKPQRLLRLSTGSMVSTSVYAMQLTIMNGKEYLLAGCYDGVLRQYDVEAVLSKHQRQLNTDPEDHEMVLPVKSSRDRFDPSAIYCLCPGVGRGGEEVAAGTARHGVCKFFRSDSADEADSWSMFAAHPSQSPTYSLVGQFDRLFGVTDALFWEVDLRHAPSLPAARPIPQQHTLAFYRHGELLLERTRWPVRETGSVM